MHPSAGIHEESCEWWDISLGSAQAQKTIFDLAVRLDLEVLHTVSSIRLQVTPTTKARVEAVLDRAGMEYTPSLF